MKDALGAPRILLAAFTGALYLLEHFEILFTRQYRIDIRVFGGLAENSRDKKLNPDLVIQLGLGEDETQADRISKEGLTYLAKLRGEFRDVPILVISRHSASYALENVRQAGGSAFLQQGSPDEVDRFIKQVEELLKTKTAG